MKIRDIAFTVAVTMLDIHMAIISLIITVMVIVIATATIIDVIIMGIIIDQRRIRIHAVYDLNRRLRQRSGRSFFLNILLYK